METFSNFINSDLLLEARSLADYTTDRLAKYRKVSSYVDSLWDSHNLPKNEEVLRGFLRPNRDEILKDLKLKLFNNDEEVLDVVKIGADFVDLRKIWQRIEYAESSIGLMSQRLNNVLKVSIPKLSKNSRVEWMLDWAEYLFVVNSLNTLISKPTLAIFNKPFSKITKKIESKYNNIDVPEEWRAYEQLLEIFEENKPEDIEKLLQRDGFMNPLRKPSELLHLIYNRMESVDKFQVYEIISKLDELKEDKITLGYILELFNKDEELDEENVKEALGVVASLITEVKPAIRDLRRVLKASDSVAELFDGFFPSDEDVTPSLTVGDMEWVSEDGDSADDRFQDHMSNCGVDEEADTIFSLCDVHPYNNINYYFSRITASTRESTLLQIHGYNNSKPDIEYHDEIVSFLQRFINEIDYSNAHMPQDCLDLDDLSPSNRSKVSNITIAQSQAEVLEEIKQYLDDALGSEVSWDIRGTELDISQTITLPNIFEDFSHSYGDYEVEDGELTVSSNGATLTDYEDDRWDVYYAESAVEDFHNKVDEIDFDEIMGDLLLEKEDDPKFRILNILNELAAFDAHLDDGSITPYWSTMYLKISKISGETSAGYHFDKMHFNTADRLPPQSELDLRDDTPSSDRHPPMPLSAALRAFTTDGYLDKFLNGNTKIPKIKDPQTKFNFDESVSLLISESDYTATVNGGLYVGSQSARIKILFPPITQYDDISDVSLKYSPFLRDIHTMSTKHRQLTEYICQFLNSHPEGIPDGYIITPRYNSTSDNDTRGAIKQASKMQFNK